MRSLGIFTRFVAGLAALIAISVVPAESSGRSGGDRGAGVHKGSVGQGGHTVRRHKRGGDAGQHRRAYRQAVGAQSARTVHRGAGTVRFSAGKHRDRHEFDHHHRRGIASGPRAPAQSAVTVRRVDGALYAGEIHVRRSHGVGAHRGHKPRRDRDIVLIRKLNPWLASQGHHGPKVIRRLD